MAATKEFQYIWLVWISIPRHLDIIITIDWCIKTLWLEKVLIHLPTGNWQIRWRGTRAYLGNFDELVEYIKTIYQVRKNCGSPLRKPIYPIYTNLPFILSSMDINSILFFSLSPSFVLNEFWSITLAAKIRTREVPKTENEGLNTSSIMKR